MSINTKTLAILAIPLTFIVLLAGMTIWQLGNIGKEIKAIAYRDIPLTKSISDVTIHQLEQAILLEKILRLASTGKKAETNKEIEKFISLENKIKKELSFVEQKINRYLEKPIPGTIRSLFEELSEKLKSIHTSHDNYGTHFSKVFQEIRSGKINQSHITEIENEAHALNAAFEEALQIISKLTMQEVKLAENHEIFTLNSVIIISILSLLISATISIYSIRRMIIKPVKSILKGLEAITNKDLSVEINVTGNDEIAELASSFTHFKEALKETEALKHKQEETEKQAEKKRKESLNQLANEFEQNVGNIVTLLLKSSHNLNGSAEKMGEISESNSQQATSVTEVSEQSSDNVKSVATATEELTKTIKEISLQVNEGTSATNQAVEEVEKTRQQMNVLTETSEKIGEVISMISGIAEQTNLLALNATIESARAGEAGKGFAVVAGEVKALATQTAKATEEISQQINDIQSATGLASSSMQQVVDVISNVNTISINIASAMEEQETTTLEISNNIQKISSGTEQVSSNIRSVSEASQEANMITGTVVSLASELSTKADTLNTEVDRFIKIVRAG